MRQFLIGFTFVAAFIAPVDPVLAEIRTLSLNEANDKIQSKMISEAVSVFNGDRDYLVDSIPDRQSTGMDEFQYKRFYDNEVSAVMGAPSLWNDGDVVEYTYSGYAELYTYDFESELYRVCVPSGFIPRVGWRGGDIRMLPNIAVIFDPRSIPETADALAPECSVANRVEAAGGEGVVYRILDVRMNAQDAEALKNRTRTGELGQDVVKFFLKCRLGPPVFGGEKIRARFNGVDCSVNDGHLGFPGQEVSLPTYDAEAVAAAEAAAAAEAKTLEEQRIANLPEPTVSVCTEDGFSNSYVRYPNCEIVEFAHPERSYTRMTIGDDTSKRFCLNVVPADQNEVVSWEWIQVDGVSGVTITPSDRRLPTKVAVFETEIGSGPPGLYCGYSGLGRPTADEGSTGAYQSLLARLGTKQWGGIVFDPGEFPEEFVVKLEGGRVSFDFGGGELRGEWYLDESSNPPALRQDIQSGRSWDGDAYLRVAFVGNDQLNVEWRAVKGKDNPSAIAVLQPKPLYEDLFLFYRRN